MQNKKRAKVLRDEKGRIIKGSGQLSNGRPRIIYKKQEWYQEMLTANKMQIKIDITQTDETGNEVKKTRDINFETDKDFRTAIFARLLTDALGGNVSAAKEILNRAEPLGELGKPQGETNPIDNMTPAEIKEEIRQIAETRKQIVRFRRSGT